MALRRSAAGGGRTLHPFDVLVAVRAPTPTLPRKRERELRRDAERSLSTNRGINTLALLPLPLAGEVDALCRSAAGGGRTLHPFDVPVAVRAPTPTLPRKRERELRRDAERGLIAKSKIMLPPPAP